jgi:iron complex outermembrane receptor protein
MNVMQSAVKTRLRTGVAAIALIAASSYSSVSHAQAAPAANQAAAEIDEVVITGSRIVRDGYEAPTP